MRAVAFILSTLVLLPYAVLAVGFVLLGRAISGGSLMSFLGAILTQADWFIPWGLLAALCSVVALIFLGVSPQTRRVGAVILLALALASVATIWVLSTKSVGLPELTFLMPCIAVAAFAAWSAMTDQ